MKELTSVSRCVATQLNISIASGGGPSIEYAIKCTGDSSWTSAQLGTNDKSFLLPGKKECLVRASDTTGILSASAIAHCHCTEMQASIPTQGPANVPPENSE